MSGESETCLVQGSASPLPSAKSVPAVGNDVGAKNRTLKPGVDFPGVFLSVGRC